MSLGRLQFVRTDLKRVDLEFAPLFMATLVQNKRFVATVFVASILATKLKLNEI